MHPHALPEYDPIVTVITYLTHLFMSLTGLVTVESDTEVCESPGAFLMACFNLTSNFTIEDGTAVDIAIQDIDTSGEQTQTEMIITSKLHL